MPGLAPWEQPFRTPIIYPYRTLPAGYRLKLILTSTEWLIIFEVIQLRASNKTLNSGVLAQRSVPAGVRGGHTKQTIKLLRPPTSPPHKAGVTVVKLCFVYELPMSQRKKQLIAGGIARLS